MKSLLEKLERKASNLLNIMDEQLNEPTVRVMTGDIFTHGTAQDEPNAEPLQRVKPDIVTASPEPTKRKNSEEQPLMPPVLRQAKAK